LRASGHRRCQASCRYLAAHCIYLFIPWTGVTVVSAHGVSQLHLKASHSCFVSGSVTVASMRTGSQQAPEAYSPSTARLNLAPISDGKCSLVATVRSSVLEETEVYGVSSGKPGATEEFRLRFNFISHQRAPVACCGAGTARRVKGGRFRGPCVCRSANWHISERPNANESTIRQ
jgi:hypothetical protein